MPADHPVFSSEPIARRSTTDGEIAIFAPRPNVRVSRIVGQYSGEIADVFMDTLTPSLLRGDFIGLHDWTEATGFDTMVPPRLAAWTTVHLLRIRRLVIATAHPLMSMAVRTTNLTLKRIEPMNSREELLVAVRETLDSPSLPPRPG